MITASTRGGHGASGLPRRAREGRLLGGVCSGLERRYAVDRTLLRLGFILLALAWGVGLVLYAALWLLLPDEKVRAVRGMRDSVRRNIRHWGAEARASHRHVRAAWARTGADSTWPRPLSRRWIALSLALGGTAIVLASFGAFEWLNPIRAIGLAAIGIGVGTILSLK